MQRERERVSASRLFPEGGKGESSARVIVARNFNPPLASPRTFPRFSSRRAFPVQGKGGEEEVAKRKTKNISAIKRESCGVHARGLSFRLFSSKMGLRPSHRAPFGGSNDPKEAFVGSFFG